MFPGRNATNNYKALDCDDAAAGSKFRIGALQRGVPNRQWLGGTIEKTQGKFVTRKLEGRLTVRQATEYINFELPEDDKSASVHLQKITLVR